jgi:hypothetical protein
MVVISKGSRVNVTDDWIWSAGIPIERHILVTPKNVIRKVRSYSVVVLSGESINQKTKSKGNLISSFIAND